jgi:hypothetical protein
VEDAGAEEERITSLAAVRLLRQDNGNICSRLEIGVQWEERFTNSRGICQSLLDSSYLYIYFRKFVIFMTYVFLKNAH